MPQDQKIVKDERGQEQPSDKKRAQQTDQQVGAGNPPPKTHGLTEEQKRQVGLEDEPLPEGIQDKQHGVQNPPREEQKGEQKKQPGQQY